MKQTRCDGHIIKDSAYLEGKRTRGEQTEKKRKKTWKPTDHDTFQKKEKPDVGAYDH